MKASKYLATIAVIIFGVTGLAVAQQLGEGYYGQQANPPAVTESQPASPCLLAQLHGMNGNTVTTEMPACCFDAANQKSEQKKTEKGKSITAPTAQEGDPSAPQNHVEYGGGGM